MNCEEFAFLLDTPKDRLTEDERKAMAAHAAECPACAKWMAIKQEMRAMDQEETVPERFSASWRAAIRSEERQMRKQDRFNWQRMLATAAAIVFVAGGTALSYVNGWGLGNTAANERGEQIESADYDSGAGNYVMKSSLTMDAGAAKMRNAQGEAKIVRTVDLSLKTQRYDSDLTALRELAASFGGHVEAISVSGDGSKEDLRYASLTLRIPSDQVDAFVSGVNSVGTVSSYSESQTDVSESYYDLQARLDTQLAKMARLQELMEQAQTTSDLIELESAISDTQYMIDSYTGQLNGYDSRIDASYVYVTLREISPADAAEDQGLSFGKRIVNAMKASVTVVSGILESFAVFALAVLPWVAALGVIILLVRIVVKRLKR